jgi:hypothetical protein
MELQLSIKRFGSMALTGLLFGPLLAFAATDVGTLMVGHATGGQCGGRMLVYSGYKPSLSIGSYSPTGLTGGRTVTTLADFTQAFCGVNLTSLSVSGFTTNPGSGWLTSVTCNGISNSGGSGSFSFADGTATWSWNRGFGLLPLPTGTNVSCTIVHN